MRVFNFSAGPSMLPLAVLEQCAKEMTDYNGSGMSVMEMSHRSSVYDEIIKEAEKNLRELMNIPENYKVLFLQGGASTQFAAVPLNLMKKHRNTVMLNVSQALKTELSHTYPQSLPTWCVKMQTMFMFATTTLFSVQSIPKFPMLAIKF